jgi:hypothetical protein
MAFQAENHPASLPRFFLTILSFHSVFVTFYLRERKNYAIFDKIVYVQARKGFQAFSTFLF